MAGRAGTAQRPPHLDIPERGLVLYLLMRKAHRLGSSTSQDRTVAGETAAGLLLPRRKPRPYHSTAGGGATRPRPRGLPGVQDDPGVYPVGGGGGD
jgi:hypothetical protein